MFSSANFRCTGWFIIYRTLPLSRLNYARVLLSIDGLSEWEVILLTSSVTFYRYNWFFSSIEFDMFYSWVIRISTSMVNSDIISRQQCMWLYNYSNLSTKYNNNSKPPLSFIYVWNINVYIWFRIRLLLT